MSIRNDVSANGGLPRWEPLRQLLKAAYAEFTDPEHQLRITDYVLELDHLMSLDGSEADPVRLAHAQATRDATGEDVVSLLCKLEDYLESIMVATAAKKVGGA